MVKKRDKDVQGDNPFVIPSGRAVRVRNFKLWRGAYTLGNGKDKFDVDCLYVSDLDGSWMVRIPSTMGVYSMICNAYSTADEELRDNFLGMVLTNIYNLSTINSEALHDAFFFLSEMMTFPYLLLSEKEMVKRMKAGLRDAGMSKSSIKEHISELVDYRHQLYDLIERKKSRFIEDYERQQIERRAKESEANDQLEHDELAEQALNVLKDSVQT